MALKNDTRLEPHEIKKLSQYASDAVNNQDNELDGVEFTYNIEEYELDNNVGKPSFKKLIPENMPYPIWVRDVFFKEFVWLPDAEIQATLLSLLAFQNSMVVPRDTIFPHWYLLSDVEGSGKSVTAKWIGNHYPNEFYLYLPEDISFGGLRNAMDSVCKYGQPTFVLLDNFNPESTLKRIGAGYSRLLKNTRSESTTYIANSEGKGSIEFASHSTRVFTSIFKLGNTGIAGSELKSRCLHAKFEPSEGRLKQNIRAFDWSDCRREYFKIWSNPQRSNQIFKSALMQLEAHPNPPLADRQWQLSIVPIAVGLMTDIFHSLDEGIEFFEQYWKWWRIQTVGGSSPISLLLDEYWANVILPRIEKEIKIRGKDSKYLQAAYQVPLVNIRKYIRDSGTSSKVPDSAILDYAATKGFKPKVLGGKIILVGEPES